MYPGAFPEPPLENKTEYLLAFPRPPVTILLENGRVIVWSYRGNTAHALP
jgi:hypothetical protein